MILCEPQRPIPPETLSERVRNYRREGKAVGGLKDQLADLERRLILDALERSNQNKSHAAQFLGITRQTIISKLKQYRRGG
jgi:DNA-binding NtrC family response regulator